MTELAEPLAVRLAVSFAAAVFDGAVEIDGVRGELVDGDAWREAVARGAIAVIVDPAGAVVESARPVVLVDAIMAKRNTGTSRRPGCAVIGLGPGFSAGGDVDAVIETLRGPDMGRVIRSGPASADTGRPGEIGGRSTERVLRAPADGRLEALRGIGDVVKTGEPLFRVAGSVVVAPFDGCLRGLIHHGCRVTRGLKVGDLDPRGDPSGARSVSDKALAVGRGVVEAVRGGEAWRS